MRKRDQSQVWCRIGWYSLAKRRFVRRREKIIFRYWHLDDSSLLVQEEENGEEEEERRKGFNIICIGWRDPIEIVIYFTIWHMYFESNEEGKTNTFTDLRDSEGRSSRPSIPGSRRRLQSSNATYRTQTTFDTVHKTIIAWPRLVFLSIAWPI